MNDNRISQCHSLSKLLWNPFLKLLKSAVQRDICFSVLLHGNCILSQMNILMQTSHSYSSIKQEPVKKKQRKAFTAMNILPFLDLDSGPFFFRAIQIIAADKIQQGQFPRI